MEKRKRIVVTGMGLVSCFGSDPKKFFQSLLEGKSGVEVIDDMMGINLATYIGAPAKDDGLDEYFDRKEARRVDLAIKYAVAAGHRAVKSAGLDLESLDHRKIGAIVGSGMGGMNVYVEGVEAMLTKGYDRVSPFFVPFILTNMPTAYLAMKLTLKGPVYSVSTACATSNHSIFQAMSHIHRGDADIMLAGGVEASINRMCFAGFNALKALSRRNDQPTKASRPWDIHRDGFVIGDGSAVLVLEEYEHAKKRGATILAEISGAFVNCDAHHITEPNPEGTEVAYCMEKALEDAGIEPKDIGYVNAHATSTPVGDLCEIVAMERVFKDHIKNVSINATKSLIGHGLGAAGALEGVVSIFTLLEGKIHPTLNLDTPEKEVQDLDIVTKTAKEKKVDHVMSNSFGFGGHNSVVIFSRYKG